MGVASEVSRSTSSNYQHTAASISLRARALLTPARFAVLLLVQFLPAPRGMCGLTRAVCTALALSRSATGHLSTAAKALRVARCSDRVSSVARSFLLPSGRSYNACVLH